MRTLAETLRRAAAYFFAGTAAPAHFLKRGAWDTISTSLLIEYEILAELGAHPTAFVSYEIITGAHGPAFDFGTTRIFLSFLADRQDALANPAYYVRYILWVMQRSQLIEAIPWMPGHFRIRMIGHFMLRYPFFLRFLSRTSILTHRKEHIWLGSKVVMRSMLGWFVRVVILVIAAQYLVPLWHGIVWYFSSFE